MPVDLEYQQWPMDKPPDTGQVYLSIFFFGMLENFQRHAPELQFSQRPARGGVHTKFLVTVDLHTVDGHPL